ncbi:MAG: hypothetical protein AB7V44_19825, partial [Pseudonocardia sp.]
MPGARTWSLSAAPPGGAGEAIDSFHHLISATHLPWDLDADARALHPGVEVVAQPVGPLSVVECACGAVSGRRGRRQIAASPQEYVGALFVHDGWEIVAQGETEVLLEPGMALLWDSTRPARFAVPSRIRKRTLFVPRARLGDLGPGASRLAGAVLPDEPATRLLESFLTAVVATLREAPRQDAERNAGAVVTATLELLANAVEQRERPPEAWQQRRWETVRDYVEEHLADPGLDPAAIARGAAVSVRTLYDLFAARGETVARYVTRRRLERARC